MQLPPLHTSSYRYPNEQITLVLTILLVFAVIAISATVTLCASALFFLVIVGVSYFAARSQHQALLNQAQPVTFQSAPRLAGLAQECAVRLQPSPVEVFVAGSHTLNAYTFGLTRPNSIVLYSSLLETMDEDELRFIIGHEMGHVRLGHTWLNTLVGGMAGIPTPIAAAAILIFAFRWWNRSCEFSADRAGLLACGRPEKAISALVKLVLAPGMHSPAQIQSALRQIELQDNDDLSHIAETLSTHPLLAHRIEQLRAYAVSAQYRQLMGVESSPVN
jgi:Zn-dependent protease with chaperone function